MHHQTAAGREPVSDGRDGNIRQRGVISAGGATHVGSGERLEGRDCVGCLQPLKFPQTLCLQTIATSTSLGKTTIPPHSGPRAEEQGKQARKRNTEIHKNHESFHLPLKGFERRMASWASPQFLKGSFVNGSKILMAPRASKTLGCFIIGVGPKFYNPDQAALTASPCRKDSFEGPRMGCIFRTTDNTSIEKAPLRCRMKSWHVFRYFRQVRFLPGLLLCPPSSSGEQIPWVLPPPLQGPPPTWDFHLCEFISHRLAG